jgi:hypothetical protein
MSAVIMEEQLLVALGTDADLTAAGCAAEVASPDGIIVRRGPHYRGAWRWERGTYAFTPAGYSEATLNAETIDEALLVTRQMALK